MFQKAPLTVTLDLKGLPALVLISLQLILPAFNGLVIYSISKRKNWARLWLVFYQFYFLSTILPNIIATSMTEAPNIYQLLSQAVNLIVLYLLFTSPVSQLFVARKKDITNTVIAGILFVIMTSVMHSRSFEPTYIPDEFKSDVKHFYVKRLCTQKILDENHPGYPSSPEACSVFYTKLIDICYSKTKVKFAADISPDNVEQFRKIIVNCIDNQLNKYS